MSTPLINLYGNDPTAGAQDGDLLVAPVTPTVLDSIAENTSNWTRLAVRTEVGYHADSVLLAFAGNTAPLWRFGYGDDPQTPQLFGEWGASLTLEDIASINTPVWVQAKCTKNENPVEDATVTITLTALVEVDQ